MKKTLRFFLVAVVLSLFLMMLPAFCIAQGDAGEAIQFHDDVLEAIVRKHLDRAEGPVTIKDARGLDWLDANMPWDIPDEEKIRDVSALRYFENLRGLHLDNNLISDISPLAGLTQLKELSVLDNPVKDIQPVSGLTGLRFLGIRSDFQDVSFIGSMTELEGLRIDGLEQLPEALLQLKGLKVFCSLGGKLSDISLLARIPALEVVDVSWNRITDLSPLSGLPLRELYLEGNPIVDYSPIRELYPNLQGKNFDYIEFQQPDNPGLVIRFPDPVMEQKVRQALNIPQGEITAGDAARVSILMLANEWEPQIPAETQITDITGIERFINLQELDCNFNAVEDISGLAGLTQLKRLSLGGNRLSDISVLAGLTKLEGLEIFGNSIRDIRPLSGLASLRSLHLSSMPVRDLGPIQSLTQLDILYLGGCGVRDIGPLAGMVNMCRLELKDNYITDLSPLSGMTRLEALMLANNPIQDYTPIEAVYGNLREKDFEYGQVFDVLVPLLPDNPDEPVSIPDAGLEAILRQATGVYDRPLTREDLGDIWKIVGETDGMWREVKDISPLKYCLNMDGLVIMSSKISDLTPLAGLTNLHFLCVADSAVSDLTPLSGMQQLTNLQLRGNRITDVAPIQALTNLERLDLANNQIADFSPLFGLQNLGVLFISNNPAADTSGFQDIYPKLMERDFEPGQPEQPQPPASDLLMPKEPDKVIRFADKVLEARIREALGKPEGAITAGDAAMVEELFLGNEYQEKFPKGSQITELGGIGYFINLRRLDISWHKISDISLLAKLTRLEYLRAYGNQIISAAPLAKLENLEHLNLGGNSLSKIDELKNLGNLKSLSLNENRLTKIDALKNLTNLTELFLNGNKIKDYSPVKGYYDQLTQKDFTLE